MTARPAPDRKDKIEEKGLVLETQAAGKYRIGRLITWVAFCLTTAIAWGCVTQQAAFPEAPPVPTVSGGKQIGLAAVRDARGTTEVGSLGLAGFRAGGELDDHLHKVMESRLSGLNFWVVMVPDSSQIESNSPGKFKGKVIQVTLVSASASSPDALLVPANCEVVLAISVYEASGKIVYQQHYSSASQSRLASFDPASSVGRAISETADAALDHAFADQQFMTAIR